MQLLNATSLQRQQNDFLLTVTKSIFQDIVSIDSVITKIMVLLCCVELAVGEKVVACRTLRKS